MLELGVCGEEGFGDRRGEGDICGCSRRCLER